MAASSDEAAAIAAPIVFQCGGCHRVISDSNQLIDAVSELGVLVLDAVVGLRVDEADGAQETYRPLRCSACEHLVGRLYREAPQPSLTSVVHTHERPRYALIHGAIASYVLGSAAAHTLQHDAADAAAPPADELSSVPNGTGAGALQLGTAGRLDALEGSEASMQQQLTQLMRVVLALDQRLRSIEEAGQPPTGEAEEATQRAGGKRPR